MLPRVITKLVGWAVAVFYDVERTGPALAAGSVLVTANHPNALVDPLVIFRTGGRPSRPLAKAPLFEQALVGTMLRGLGGLPVYRRQDDPSLMHLNERTFDAAIAALHAGEAVQIYPEGQSHSGLSLSPLRTGAARIAFQAEEGRDWKLGLRVQPVGLTYTRKHLFRGRVVAAFGDPFLVSDLRAEYEADDQGAVQLLTSRIRERLEALTLSYDDVEDRGLVDVAERLYAREKKLVEYRERQPLAARLPRLRGFTEGIRWLRAADPDRLRDLRLAVRRYLNLLTLLGASEGDVPRRYPRWEVARYVLRQVVLLALVLPAAFLGAVAWMVPFLITRHVAPLFRPQLDQVATYKLGTAFLAFPAWWAVVVVACFFVGGLGAAIAAAVAAPVLGLAAIAWRDREARVAEDVRVFLRARRHRRGRDRLGELRAELVAEFDAISEERRLDQA